MEAVMIVVNALAEILDMALLGYSWVVIIAALISWVNPDPYNPIVQFLYRFTEPLYDFMRRYIRTTFQGFDFAPIIVLFAIMFLRHSVVRILLVWSSGAWK
ncbi:YggT family protein [Campylobacterota bacterium]|nr:YggT family protein [Campylobacterota bacterium]